MEGRIRTRLCEGMRSMKSSCLNEWNVTIDGDRHRVGISLVILSALSL
jgi:hypothetical protein